MNPKMPGQTIRSAMLALLLGALMLTTPLAMPHALANAKTTLGDLPPAAQSLISATLGRDDATYQFQSTDDGYRLPNASDALSIDWSHAGMRIQAGKAQWAMGLRAIGYGDALEPISPVAPSAKANRLEYVRDTFTEWYVNGPAGLEQGWTLTVPPSARQNNPLTLALALEGNARLDASGSSIALLSDDGAVALNYTGLVAYDATGRNLRAWFEFGETSNLTSLQIRVDDTDAQYPLTIDPYLLRATLKNGFGASDDKLGNSIAMSADGSTIVAGAWPVNNSQGAAYVFVKPSGGWATTLIPSAALTFALGNSSDHLGSSVAISADGTTIVAGATGVNSYRGAAYVFVKPNGGWTTTGVPNAVLTNSGSISNDHFGGSVATSADGTTIVAGADGVDSDKGAAYVFIKPSGGWATDWTPNAVLMNSSGTISEFLGNSVATSADGATVVAGAYGVSGGRGAAYVFVKSGNWATTVPPTAVLTKSGGASGDSLGISVAMSADGSAIVAGARGVDVGGAAYVFVKPGVWVTTSAPTAVLTNSGGAIGDFLGWSVAMSADGSTIAAGAVGASSNRGAAYVFAKPGDGWATDWTPNAVLTIASAAGNDGLGRSVAINTDGATIVAGADGTDNSKGAAYVFYSPYSLYLPLIKK